MQEKIEADIDAILVAEENGKILGTISLIEDGRVAWLFRFCVEEGKNKDEIAQALFEEASKALKKRRYNQVLVYTQLGIATFIIVTNNSTLSKVMTIPAFGRI